MDTIKSFREYDYYILCEDDYVFVQDNFDKHLVTIYKEKYNSEGYFTTYDGNDISTIGILSKKEIENSNYFSNYKHIYYGVNDDPKHGIMRGFMALFKIHSITDKYPVFPYWGKDCISIYTADKRKRTPEEIKDQTLLTCIQFLDDNCEIDCKKFYNFIFC